MKAVVCTLLLASLGVFAAVGPAAAQEDCDNCNSGKHRIGQGHAARKASRQGRHYAHAQYGPYAHRSYRSSSDYPAKHCFGQCRGVQYRPWHCGYYHTEYGAPVALVMPPTAELTTNMGWGVSNTRVTKICHQFARPYPGYGATGAYPLMPTPHWPSDTAQFGVYPVRAPFK